jgi:hypothetical protein
MNAVIYNFGRLKRLAPIVGTKRLASNRGLVGEPSNPPTGIDFRFGRSHLKETSSSCRSKPKDKFLHTFMDHSKRLYLKPRVQERGTRRNFRRGSACPAHWLPPPAVVATLRNKKG